MSGAAPRKPDWHMLYALASGQLGYFTTKQAACAGYSSQLLAKHVRAGRVARVQRWIYRLVHFPACDHEELVPAWLWSEAQGVASHETALWLHGLSDVLPAHLHFTLPLSWRTRRLCIPPGVVIHYAEVLSKEQSYFGAVPATSPRRTLQDCAPGLPPNLLQRAARQALERGLVASGDLAEVRDALAPYGGLAAVEQDRAIDALVRGGRSIEEGLAMIRRLVEGHTAPPKELLRALQAAQDRLAPALRELTALCNAGR